MARRTYSDEERRRALELVAEVGVGAAHEQTGIPKPTLSSWAKKHGVRTVHPERTRAALEQQSLNREERRSRLADRLLEIAELSVERTADMLEGASLRDVVGLFTRAIHDHQLLTGGATARTEASDPKLAAEQTVDELTARRERKQAA